MLRTAFALFMFKLNRIVCAGKAHRAHRHHGKKKTEEKITLFSFCSSFPFAFDFLLFFVIILLYHSYRFASYSFTLFGSSSSFLFCVHLSSFFTAAALAAVVVHSSFIISFIHIFVWLWLHGFLSHSFFIHRERKNDVPTLSLPSSFSE